LKEVGIGTISDYLGKKDPVCEIFYPAIREDFSERLEKISSFTISVLQADSSLLFSLF